MLDDSGLILAGRVVLLDKLRSPNGIPFWSISLNDPDALLDVVTSRAGRWAA